MNTNKSSSDLTHKIRNQILYANYIIQKQQFDQGCSLFLNTQSGSGASKESSIWTDIVEGRTETTSAEQASILANNTCPVVVNPPPVVVIDYNTDAFTFARRLNSLYGDTTVTPTSGGALKLAGLSVGNYEYTTRPGNTTISSFSDSDWFTSTEDTVSSWITINGNLTINSGQTLIPTKRKLFTVLYVKGNLTVSGSISMSLRGANHSGTGSSGGYTAPVNIAIALGTYGDVTNPQIPATGGAGGAQRATNGGNNGTDGSDGGTGGGGSGQRFLTGTAGGGSAGTCFSGGTAGAAGFGTSAAVISGSGEINGGRGGDANVAGNQVSAGGAGNPGGTGTGLPNGPDGQSGTGGTLIIFCEGALSGLGTITSNGQNGIVADGQIAGGASGGGSVTVFYKTNPSSAVTITANGGNGGSAGAGGNGTARKLALP